MDVFYLRVSTLLGNLLTTTVDTKRTGASLTETYNVLPLATSVPRFTLLPISGSMASRRTSSMLASNEPTPATSRPRIDIHLSKASTKEVSSGRVMGIVNAVAGNIPASHQQKATELFQNASSFITNVWGSSPKISK